MKENVLKSFVRDTYKNTSYIPYIITGQAFMFVLLHIFELLKFDEVIAIDLFDWTYSNLSLSSSFWKFLEQPWSIVTHPFIYQSIFSILFDCLWLYWIGNIFLNFLSNRQFLFVFLTGLLAGALIFLGVSSISYFASQPQQWNSTTFGLAALISSTGLLVPNYEIRLFLLGNVKLKTIAIIYLLIEFAMLAVSNEAAAISYILTILFGVLYMLQLQKGKDWSLLFKKRKRHKHLKVIHNQSTTPRKTKYRNNTSDLPDQELIDQILDKISISGYESLNSYEKEVLFRASKQEE